MLKQLSEFIFQKKEFISNIKNAGLYFAGSIVQSILSLIASPIYSIHLSADEFGILGYFDAIKSFLVPIFLFGMTYFYLMKYFKQSEEDNKKLLFNITFFLCCFNTIMIFISYIFIYIYFERMNVIIPLNPFAWFILIALLLDNFKSFVLINYRVRKKAFSFFMFSSLNAILNFGFGLLFVASFKWGVEGRMLAPIISSFMLLPFAIYILLKFSTISFNFNLFLKAAKISIPLVLAAYAYVPIASIDRFYLERLNNLSELGLYNIGVTIAGYVQLAFIALTSAIEPDIFKGVANNDNKLLLKSALITFVPYFLISGVFILFSGIIISVLTAGRYIDAEKYANITMISVFLMGIYWFSEKIFIALEKTKINLVINIIGGVFSVIIIYFAVQNFQFIGAAYGKVIVAFLIIMVQFILIYFNLKQKIPTHK